MSDYKALKEKAAKANQAKGVAEAARLVAEKETKHKLEREKASCRLPSLLLLLPQTS